MDRQIFVRIRGNPKFEQLTSERSRLAWLLTAIVLLSYYSFIMVIAFGPHLLRVPLWPGSALSVGVPLGALIIIGSWLLTGYYVRRANNTYERLNEELIKEAS